MDSDNKKKEIRRSDYQPPAFWVRKVEMDVEVDPDACVVTSRLTLERNRASSGNSLILQGRQMKLRSLQLDGVDLAEAQYSLNETELRIETLPDQCLLTVQTEINPGANTSGEGFYTSGNILCTQCEAHGFSRITYFPDRPDILSTYRVTIRADKSRYPILLANGNRIEKNDLSDGRHEVVWEDPFPKPCYLFAMVAGDLACVEDSYTTCSGRDVRIHFYIEPGDEDQCGQAIASLKKAMAWDEQTYGLEYDLDIYMVVAVGSFNMGAMENKGLNIFNSRYVLASPDTATDIDYSLIQAVIGHEYFHNWTGNRVTCRDWFQLSLKEGLTVFREQQFMEDSLATSTQRIEHVRLLRGQQFAEDASPMAHPVRPEAYIEVNNFYTLTVYEKGSEVIRMLRSVLGAEQFTKGVQHYLQKHDGSAATIDDFIQALEESSGMTLTAFQNWYSQAGTPKVRVTDSFEQDTGLYKMNFVQETPPTPGQAHKNPVPIPIEFGLISQDGRSLHNDRLVLDEAYGAVEIRVEAGVRPVPVFLRGFSAPVKLEYLYSRDDLENIAAHETDGFCRWDAMQRIYLDVFEQGINGADQDYQSLLDLQKQMLSRDEDDISLIAELLTLPAETLVAESYDCIPVEGIASIRDSIEMEIATGMREDLLKTYARLHDGKVYEFEPEKIARRRLKNLCLSYLAQSGVDGQELALKQFHAADNMTDRLGAMEALNHRHSDAREEVMQVFADQWASNPLVMDKWLQLQATSRIPGTFDRVRAIRNSDSFDAGNPNRIRSLIGAFTLNNLRNFHLKGGEAYDWLADEIIRLDSINPQVASRLCTALIRWQRYDAHRGTLMKAALQKIGSAKKLSGDVFEMVSRSLNSGD